MSATPLNYQGQEEKPTGPRYPTCGSSRTVLGSLAGDVAFRPNKLRKFFHLSGMVKLDAIACSACGVVTLCVDRDKLINVAGDLAQE